MSDLVLVIGNKNYSSWSFRPWLFMKHLEIPFSEIRVPLYQSDWKEQILKHSPSGKVPCLIDGDLHVWDSLAICEYLADKYPNKQSWPKDIKARAKARAICAEMHSGFFDLRSELPMNCRRIIDGFVPSEKAEKDILRVRNIWSSCRNEFKTDGPWLFGQFSIADCMYAPVVSRFMTYRIDLSDEEWEYAHFIYNHPAVIKWLVAARDETETINAVEI